MIDELKVNKLLLTLVYLKGDFQWSDSDACDQNPRRHGVYSACA